MAAGKRKKRTSKTKGSNFKSFVLSFLISFSSVLGIWGIAPNELVGQIKGLTNQNLSFINLAFDSPSFEHLPTKHSGADNLSYVQTSFTDCPEFFPNNTPPIVPGASDLKEICFSYFATLYNGNTKTPVFTVEKLNRNQIFAAKGIERTNRFYEEGRLPGKYRATLADYRGSGYDRGHMAPAGDMYNETAMAQSFSLANIVPQDAHHNRSVWSKVEADTRKYIQRAKGDVYIFTGPFYTENTKTIGKNKVAIPSYIYKVVYDPEAQKSWVHWHMNSPTTKVTQPISYEDFVNRTGLNLLN